MTDRWCFTCDHEIRQNMDGAWIHTDADDRHDCICLDDGSPCEPR